MITSVADERIKRVRVTDDELVADLADGRTLSVPLVWYPRLLNASAEQRSDWHLIGEGEGVHWPQIDEDLSAAGLLRGVPAPATARAGGTGRGVSEQNKALVRRFMVEVAKGNLDAVEDVFAPNYVGHTPDSPEGIQGIEAVKLYADTFREAFPDLQVIVEDQVAEGEKVATRYTIRGTHLGELMGIAPTERQIEFGGTTIHRIEAGKIVEQWDNYDRVSMMRQLTGVAEPGWGEE
jgi:predicted ester cyclase